MERVGNRRQWLANVIAFAFFALTACSSDWGPDPVPGCGECDGNTAVECGVVPSCHDVTTYVESTEMRVDCGAKKCTVTKDTRQCTDRGTQRTVEKTVVVCK